MTASSARPPARRPVRPRLHVVTGKGGTGKSTVAAALAIALAVGGRRVLLVEVEGRQAIAQVFDTAPLSYAETRVALAPDGGEVWALSLDAEEALLEYLDVFYGMRRAGWALRRTGALDFATTVAPGIRDVLLTGKIKELVDRADADRKNYDAVVLDAPPTGRITQFLTVTEDVAVLARVGPIKSQSESVLRVLTSAATRVHVVTILEEMPVQETADAVREMTEASLVVGTVVVNMVRAPHLPHEALSQAAAGRLDPTALGEDLRAAGLPADLRTVTGLLAEATAHAQRILLEEELRHRVAAVGRPVVELPQAPGPVDISTLLDFARHLAAQGMTVGAGR